MPVRLSRATLDDVPASVATPNYRREDLRAGILHFGVGNFHRSHQGYYLDRLFSRGLGRDWGVVGAGVLPTEERMRRALAEQDYLSLLVTQSAASSEARIIGPMIDFLPIGDGDAIVARMADPAIRIVSLTVTEGGYFLDGDGNFDAGRAAIRADADAPDTPRTVFGMILKALTLRRRAGTPPFTVMSCDNLPHNGAVTRRAVAGLAALTDPAVADWIDAHVAFPNAMVDRITPATSERERRLARDVYHVEDQWPVFSEDFIQWVIEDTFSNGRPPLEAVGVSFVEDVTPYEEMKLRVLNGSHAMIAYPAALMGIDYAHDAVTHPLIARLLEKVQHEEVLPAVPAVPGMAPVRYFETVRTRFANPNIADTVDRLCHDGSNRQPKFIVPAIRDALARGLPVAGLALASALWCRYCAGTRDDGSPIGPNDPKWEALNEAALAARYEPKRWLDQQFIYGDLAGDTRLTEAFAAALDQVHRRGVRQTLEAFTGSS